MAAKAVAKRSTTGIVAYQDRLAALAQEAKATEESVQVGNWIGTRAGQLKYQGQPLAGNKFKAVILDHRLENAYFDAVFDADTPRSPVCFAFGTKDADMVPHADAESPQSEACKGCPQNVFGTAEVGKGKACKNIRRLALIHADALKEGADGVKSTPLAFLKLPVMSVKGWAGYVQQLANVLKTHPVGVITEIGAVPDDDSQFRITFSHVEQITDGDVLDALLERRVEAAEALEKPYQPNSEAPAPAPKGKAAKPAAKGAPAPAGKARRF